jgi:Domain of unknown function DUF11
MSLFRVPRKLGAARSLVAVAMLAGAAFSAVPAQAATLSSATPLLVQLSMPSAATLNQPAAYVLTVTNNTGSTLRNVIVGEKFFAGAKLSSAISGLPANSCVRGLAAFACLVTSLAPGGSATLQFSATQSVGSAATLAAAQAFVGGVFTTSSVSLVSQAVGASAAAPAPAPAPGGGHRH